MLIDIRRRLVRSLTFALLLVAGLVFSTTSVQAQELNASDAAASDEFGWSVSLSGNTAIVGARLDDDGGTGSGSAYVFRDLDTATGTITQSVKLTAFDAAAFDQFGWSVSQSGNTAIVGAWGDDDGGSISGSAYVFRDLDTVPGTPGSPASLTESVKLTASDAAAFDQFGVSISQSGNTAIVGAFGDGSFSGSAYLFRDLDTVPGTPGSPGSLTESVKLTASDAAAGDFFGESISQSGNTAIVGARLDDEGGSDSGSAYVFRGLDTVAGTPGSPGSVTESVKLTASDGATGDQFGRSVSQSGSTAIVGAAYDDDGGTDSGSAYVFRDLDTVAGTPGSPGSVTESVKLTASDAAAFDEFGISVSVDGDRFVVGARLGDRAVVDSGSAYSGTVSSVTTLDDGNVTQRIDGISFESRTDWIIGETTSNNEVHLTSGDAAEVLETGAEVAIGKNAGSNDNTLRISGDLSASLVTIGAIGNTGNQLILESGSTNTIDAITVHEGNGLFIEGNINTFELLSTTLPSTNINFVISGGTQMLTAANFNSFFSFNEETGLTSFNVSAVPEPSSVALLMMSLATVAIRRRR